MVYTIVKVLLSAILIVTIGEVSKKFTWLGGLLASLPLVSILAMIWLYLDTKSVAQVSALASSIFWMVLPSLSLFLLLPLLLKLGLHFYLALVTSSTVMAVLYCVTIFVLKKFGVMV